MKPRKYYILIDKKGDPVGVFKTRKEAEEEKLGWWNVAIQIKKALVYFGEEKSGICPVGLCNGGFGCQHSPE